ncbi:MAG: hypothetical protein AAB285_03960, partial [candidate division NC10 bacterium]
HLGLGLIVEEHGKLAYPEGTACADVLIVGEQGGTNAKMVFFGLGLGFRPRVRRCYRRAPPKSTRTALQLFSALAFGRQ